jgi:tetratricopeptide (TPR) repeat protein
MPSKIVTDLKDLSPERLERVAYDALYEAINVNRLIAFVGSGVSLVYGSLTWTQFLHAVVNGAQRRVNEAIKKLENLASSQDTLATLKRVKGQLKLYESETNDSIIILELCKQAYALAQPHIEIEGDKLALFDRDMSDLFESDARFVITSLKDRLNWFIPNGFKHLQSKREDFDEVANLSEFATNFYSLQTLEELQKLSKATTLKLLTDRLRGRAATKAKAEKAPEDDQLGTLPKDRRGIINIFMAAAIASPSAKGLKNSLKNFIDQTLKYPKPAAYTPPRPFLDPLRTLHRDLHIGRYITTNYDLEIENYFMFDDVHDWKRYPVKPWDNELPKGFSKDDQGNRWLRERPDGTRVRSDIYNGDATSRLFEFAVGSNDNLAHVFHLHGRVDKPETMIAADSDYNRLYRAESGARRTFDLAYDVTIAGNPILFVGSGLSEAELTRTLRQEVSNARAREDCFVLRPAHGRADALVREQLKIHSQFGAYVLHYGHPRRGLGFSLRRHRILIDFLAHKFDISDKTSFELIENDGPKFKWKANCKDRYKASSEKLLDPQIYQPDLDDWNACKTLYGQEFEDLCPSVNYANGNRRKVASDREAPPYLTKVQESFALLAGLNFDREATLWLLSSSGQKLKKQIDSLNPEQNARAKRLLADFLEKLSGKFEAAAVRHELRVVGEKAKLFYKEKTEQLNSRSYEPLIDPKPNAVPLHFQRHVCLDQYSSSDKFNPAKGLSHFTLRDSSKPSYETTYLQKSVLAPEPDVASFAIVYGDSGSGKGTFLRHLNECIIYGHKHKPKNGWLKTLVVNLRYGQEVDSVLTLIQEFFSSLEPGNKSVASNPRSSSQRLSRMERIHQLTERYRSVAIPKTRVLVVIAGIDRIFGVEGELLGVQFAPLLYRLNELKGLDVLLIGSKRCLKFFEKFAEVEKDSTSAKNDPVNLPTLSTLRQPRFFELSRSEGVLSGSLSHQRSSKQELSYLEHLENLRAVRNQHGARIDYRETRSEMLRGVRKEGYIVGLALDDLLVDDANDRVQIPIGTLAQEIIKVLAFIGLPTEAEVLFIAPNVREQLHTIEHQLSPSAEAFNDKQIFLQALDLAIRRGLLSIIEPHSETILTARKIDVRFTSRQDQTKAASAALKSEAGKAIEKGQRFVLHRAVSLTIRDRFGVPDSETVLSDCLQLSLYAAQPDDTPASQPSLTRELANLASRLINGWKDQPLADNVQTALNDLRVSDKKNGSHDGPNYRDSPVTPARLNALRDLERSLKQESQLGVQCVRAANGILRGFYSSANLLGLDTADRDGRPIPKGVITRHKARILKLLRTAKDLERSDTKRLGKQSINGLIDLHLRPIRELRHPRSKYTITNFSDPECEKVANALNLSLGYSGGPLCKPLLSSVSAATSTQRSAAFFPEEIAWLWNERAMLSLAQGDLYSASTTFEVAAVAIQQFEGDAFNLTMTRLDLNRALLWIERGKISEARVKLEYLQTNLLAKTNGLSWADEKVMPETSRLLAITRGYLALCDQINGLSERAKESYATAIQALNKLREQRAVAIFNLHLGTLTQNTVQDQSSARTYFDRAIGAAEAGRHTDIVYRVRVARASLVTLSSNQFSDTLSPKNISERLSDLGAAIAYGERLDMHRITVEALSVRANIRLVLGDIKAAESDIARALALSTKFGMTLRKILLRLMQGRAFQKRNDEDNAIFMYEHALSEAEAIGYVNVARAAGDRLSTLRKDNLG